jgi:putative hemolysin
MKTGHASIESRRHSATRQALQVSLTHNTIEMQEAQRLRYKVFVEALGAQLGTHLGTQLGAHPPRKTPQHESDMFDAFCDHLIVRDTGSGKVIGTTRLLPPDAAHRVGCYCAENQFNLTRLLHLRSRMVEVGRLCVHPKYRNRGVIALLWSALIEYMRHRGHDTLIGCAPISMIDGGHNAANLYLQLGEAQQAPPEYRAFAYHGLPCEHLANAAKPTVPAQFKAFLRAGAWICGEPAWNPDDNSADFLMLLPTNRISSHYLRPTTTNTHKVA